MDGEIYLQKLSYFTICTIFPFIVLNAFYSIFVNIRHSPHPAYLYFDFEDGPTALFTWNR